MNLVNYLKNRESNVDFATKLGVSPSLVSQWKNKKRPVAKHWHKKIVHITDGAVTLPELNPDLAEILAELAKQQSSEKENAA